MRTQSSLRPALVAGACVAAMWQSGCGDSQQMVADNLERAETDQALAAGAGEPDPASKLYVRYHEERSGAAATHNHRSHPNGTRTVTISAKTLTLDAADDVDVLKRFNGDLDVAELAIRADRLVVATRVKVPAARLRIHARELVFDDRAGEPAGFDLTPAAPAGRADTAVAASGIDGSSANVFAQVVEGADGEPRFILDGGRGQDPKNGANGDPGASRSLMATRWAGLVKCAESYGMTGTPACDKNGRIPKYGNQLCTSWYDTDPGITIDQLKGNVIDFGLDFPGDGKDATPAGVPGNASNGGLILTNHAGIARSMSARPGQPGSKGIRYRGGSFGTPRVAYKISGAKCVRHRYCKEIWPGRWDCRQTRRLIIESEPELRYSRNGKSVSSPAAKVLRGEEGTSGLRVANSAWIHPEAVSRSLEFAEDAFLGGHRDLARAELERLAGQVGRHNKQARDTFGITEADAVALAQQEQEIGNLLRRLGSGADYFGNPRAWVPALSLEANQLAFAQESEWAIKTIYVADWLVGANEKAVDKARALAEAKTILREEVRALEDDFNVLVDRIPGLKSSAANLGADIELMESDLQLVEMRLIAEAKDNVEDRKRLPLWKAGLRIVGGLVKALPVGQPITGGVGALAETISKFDADDPWETVFAIPEVLGKFAEETEAEKAAKAAARKRKEEKPEEEKDPATVREKLREVLKVTKPLMESLKENKELLKPVKVADDEIQAELEKLKKSDEVFLEVSERAKTLLEQKKKIVAELDEIMSALADVTVAINDKYVKLADLSEGLAGAAEVTLSRRADLALREMKADSVRRLLKYQYLLAKSYEYRTLRPYSGDFSLVRLFAEMAELASSTGADGTIDAQQYGSLFAIYRNELSKIVESIFDDYNANHTQRTLSVEYSLTGDELDVLDSDNVVTLNLFEKGLFRDDHHDIRIVGLKVSAIDAVPAGSSNSFGYLDLDIRHDGMSRLWRNGRVHVFQHYGPGTAAMEWSSRYQPDGRLTHSELSASSQSLLRSLLTESDVDLMLFSRPSAWAELNVSKTVRSDGDLDFQLDRVVLELTYDYIPAVGGGWDAHRRAQDATANRLFSAWLQRDADARERSWVRRKLDLGADEESVVADIRRVHRREIAERDIDALFSLRFGRPATADELAWASQELLRGRFEAEIEDYARRIIDIVEAETGAPPTFDDFVRYTAEFDAEPEPEPEPNPFPKFPPVDPCGFFTCAM